MSTQNTHLSKDTFLSFQHCSGSSLSQRGNLFQFLLLSSQNKNEKGKDKRLTRTGLKISDNRCFTVMNPPQSPDLNIIEAVWGHLDREWNKYSQHQKKSFGMSFKKPGELPEEYLKKLHEGL